MASKLDRLATAARSGESRTRVVTEAAAAAVLGGLAVTPGYTLTYMGCDLVGNEDYAGYTVDEPTTPATPAGIAG